MNGTDIERLAAFSDRVRDSTLKRLRLVPAGKENVRFPDGAMSCADVADHLVRSDELLFKLAITGHKPQNLGLPGQIQVADRTLFEALIVTLEALKARRREFIMAQSDASLAASIRVEEIAGTSERDLGTMIYLWLDHETHHRGALAVYLRAFETGAI